MSSLFRIEALKHQNDFRLGRAYLKIPRSYGVFLLFLLSVTLIFFLILILSNYTRKETVPGVLVPSTGLHRIYAPRNGEVRALKVKDGIKVNTGQALLALHSSTHLTTGKSLNLQQQQMLISQLATLKSQIDNEHHLSKEIIDRQQGAISELKSSIWQLRNQFKLGNKLIKLKQEQHQKTIKLVSQGYLTSTEKNNSQQELLIQQQNTEDNKRILMSRQSELKQLKHEIKQQPLLLKQTLARLSHQQAELEAQLSQLTAQEAVQLKASVAGRITALQVHEGVRIKAGQLLMTLIPSDAQLEAELYLSSRASGFILVGQTVRLRYSAFPYQRYGIFDGTITQVSEVTLTPTELRATLPLTEAVYRVRVKLSKQSVFAFGKENALQPGMKLEANIVLDTMSLLDWVMMPIYAIKGRL